MPYTRAIEGKSQNQTPIWLVCRGGVVVWRSLLDWCCCVEGYSCLLLPGFELHAEQHFLIKADMVMMQHAERDMESLALDSTIVQGPVAQG